MTKIIVKGTPSEAVAIADRVIADLDDNYQLTYIDYRDEMPEDILKAYVNEGADKAREMFYDNVDWMLEAEVESAMQILEDATTPEEMSALAEWPEELDRIKDAIYERDNSDPFQDLVNQSHRVWMVYDLGLDVPEPELVMVPHEKYGSVAEATPSLPKHIAKHLGINYKENEQALIELVSNAGYGGSLQLLMSNDIDELDGLENGYTYQFDNVAVAIIDYMNGSGHDVTLSNVEVKWSYSKLKANDFYAENVCGLVREPYSNFKVNLKSGGKLK